MTEQKQTVVLAPADSFKTIAEAAMLAALPEVFRESLRAQIVAFVKWIDSISDVEKERDTIMGRCEQLELDLQHQADEEEE